MLLEIKYRIFNADGCAAFAEIVTQLGEFRFAHRVEAHLVEEVQQPRLVGGELRIFQEFVPDRQRAAHQLIAAGRIHAVDAHVHPADPNGAFGGKGARRVIFGTQQAMARIDRHRAGCAEIDIAQA
ncbi:Uncharacterised protein [Salmonella enterica subsp. enterica serovar Typhi]|nr:Uncharacterised protein [Salmonella enterica subsp. enterica serovar Typhi]CQW20054.1 Uncharacterised protein [Salmonella enterica subsp. enterica serovar Typhi]CQY20385.1 Uncharacterised protein [Salmonella enterica subsp. enterica serovar Typhi]CRA98179.1 Uncharacterised protein [Salmonella enterica subsp. enterica serovar Typhi]